jgi:hypothetical protein
VPETFDHTVERAWGPGTRRRWIIPVVLSRCHLARPQSSWAEVQDGATGGRTVGDRCGAELRPVGFDR